MQPPFAVDRAESSPEKVRFNDAFRAAAAPPVFGKNLIEPPHVQPQMRPQPILSDRNIILEEIIQIKKELQLSQNSMRRLGDTFGQKINQIDSRLQAGESNLRTLDKRENSDAGTMQQFRSQMDVQMREMLGEMGRYRRQLESDMKGHVDTLRAEFVRNMQAVTQVEKVSLTTQMQQRNSEEQRAKSDTELKATLEKRLRIMTEGTSKFEQQLVQRTISAESALNGEVEQRIQADKELRSELSDCLSMVKNLTDREESQRASILQELRTELSDFAKAIKAELKAYRDEGEKGRWQVMEAVQDEKWQRQQESDALKRKLEGFTRVYEAERDRLQASSKHALQQMLERSKAIQEISRKIQQDGIQVKIIATKVQEESALGLKALAEKLEDALSAFRVTQDMHSDQLLEQRNTLIASVQELKDKISQGHARVQAELERNFREDRQTRISFDQKVEEWDKKLQHSERNLNAKQTTMEAALTRHNEGLKKDIDKIKFRHETILGDVRSEADETRQRLHSMEVQMEQRISAGADDIRHVQAKVYGDVGEVKGLLRSRLSEEEAARNSLAQRLHRLEILIRQRQPTAGDMYFPPTAEPEMPAKSDFQFSERTSPEPKQSMLVEPEEPGMEELDVDEMDNELDEYQRNVAATRIGAQARGMRDRKKAALLRQERDEQAQAATRIGAQARGMRDRKRAAELREQKQREERQDLDPQYTDDGRGSSSLQQSSLDTIGDSDKPPTPDFEDYPDQEDYSLAELEADVAQVTDKAIADAERDYTPEDLKADVDEVTKKMVQEVSDQTAILSTRASPEDLERDYTPEDLKADVDEVTKKMVQDVSDQTAVLSTRASPEDLERDYTPEDLKSDVDEVTKKMVQEVSDQAAALSTRASPEDLERDYTPDDLKADVDEVTQKMVQAVSDQTAEQYQKQVEERKQGAAKYGQAASAVQQEMQGMLDVVLTPRTAAYQRAGEAAESGTQGPSDGSGTDTQQTLTDPGTPADQPSSLQQSSLDTITDKPPTPDIDEDFEEDFEDDIELP